MILRSIPCKFIIVYYLDLANNFSRRVSASGAKQADVMGMMGILFSPGLGPIKLLNGTILN
jgi:hypothetical protein